MTHIRAKLFCFATLPHSFIHLLLAHPIQPSTLSLMTLIAAGHLRLHFAMCFELERLQPLKTCWVSLAFTKPTRLGCTIECVANIYRSIRISIIIPECYQTICTLPLTVGGYEPHTLKPTLIPI
jgi:hypothetical protein